MQRGILKVRTGALGALGVVVSLISFGLASCGEDARACGGVDDCFVGERCSQGVCVDYEAAGEDAGPGLDSGAPGTDTPQAPDPNPDPDPGTDAEGDSSEIDPPEDTDWQPGPPCHSSASSEDYFNKTSPVMLSADVIGCANQPDQSEGATSSASEIQTLCPNDPYHYLQVEVGPCLSQGYDVEVTLEILSENGALADLQLFCNSNNLLACGDELKNLCKVASVPCDGPQKKVKRVIKIPATDSTSTSRTKIKFGVIPVDEDRPQIDYQITIKKL